MPTTMIQVRNNDKLLSSRKRHGIINAQRRIILQFSLWKSFLPKTGCTITNSKSDFTSVRISALARKEIIFF